MTQAITQFSLIETQTIPQLLVVKLAPLKQGQLEACGGWALLAGMQLLFSWYVTCLGYSVLPFSSGALGTPGSPVTLGCLLPCKLSRLHSNTAPLDQLSRQHPPPGAKGGGARVRFAPTGSAEGGGWHGKLSAPLLCLGCMSLSLSSGFPGVMASVDGCFSALLYVLLPRAARQVSVGGLLQLQGRLYLLQRPPGLRGLSRPLCPPGTGALLGPFSL